MNRLIFQSLILIAVAFIANSCNKNKSDYRDAFVGTYTFTKTNYVSNSSYVSVGPGQTEWVTTSSSEVVWEKIGTIEKTRNDNELKIDFGPSEDRFKVRCDGNGNFYCIGDDDCPVATESHGSHNSGSITNNLFHISLGGESNYYSSNTFSVVGVR